MAENDDNLNSDKTYGRSGSSENSSGGGEEPPSISGQPTKGRGSEGSLECMERYELIEKLVQGAFGAVYRARDTVVDIDVAM